MYDEKGNLKWAVLGIHGEDVETVDGNVARVRIFTGKNDYVDEDFKLPELPFPIPKEMETTVYQGMLAKEIEARYKKLGGKR